MHYICIQKLQNILNFNKVQRLHASLQAPGAPETRLLFMHFYKFLDW